MDFPLFWSPACTEAAVRVEQNRLALVSAANQPRNSAPRIAVFWLFIFPGFLVAQSQPPSNSPNQAPAGQATSSNTLFEYLLMTGTPQDQFHPLTQKERFREYANSLFNPLTAVMSLATAASAQASNAPPAWGQGAAGYGLRLGNYLAQDTIQLSMQMGAESLLHEDNRYFQSGEHSTWARLKYALAATVLARRDSGARRFSFSGVGSLAGVAFLSRTWQPSTDNSPEHGAISFGISLATSAGMNVLKEFLPDLQRHVVHRGP
jgi:hypothetical protein